MAERWKKRKKKKKKLDLKNPNNKDKGGKKINGARIIVEEANQN